MTQGYISLLMMGTACEAIPLYHAYARAMNTVPELLKVAVKMLHPFFITSVAGFTRVKLEEVSGALYASGINDAVEEGYYYCHGLPRSAYTPFSTADNRRLV
jgi:hypothetical protein